MVMDKNSMKYLIERILEYAGEAIVESNNDMTDSFLQGKRLAYTEILDVIQIELKANGESLEEYGMDIEKINNDDYIVEWSLASEMTANNKE